MLINKIVLNNFGLYAGKHVIDLSNTSKEKPIVLIGGMNGRGKTTILEAILLSLYGRRSFAFLESKLPYPDYLKKYVNKADGTLTSFIEITFVLNSNEQSDTFTVKRIWDINVTGKTDQLTVHKNGKFDKYLSENWNTFVENILPSGISRFFFFDGEKIADIAEETTDNQMKDSIKALLGIDIIDKLIKDLKKVIIKKTKQHNLENSDSRIIELNEKNSLLTQKSAEIKQRIKNLFSKQEQLRVKLEEKETEFIKNGGSFAHLRDEMTLKKALFESKIEELNKELLELASNELPLILVTPLLEEIKLETKKEEDFKIKNLTNKTVNTILAELRRELVGIKQATNIILKYELDFQEAKETNPPIFNLSDNAKIQLDLLNSSLMKDNLKRLKSLIHERNTVQKSLEQVESYLSIDTDEAVANNLLKDIKDYTAQISDLEGKIQIFSTQLSQIETEKLIIERELNRLIEETLKNLEEKDDSARIVKYANLSINLMDKYKLALQKQKTKNLAEVMTERFLDIIDKKTLITKIDISPDTLEFAYYDKQGDKVLKSQLSAGEKQLLVIALLWALAICSRKSLPIIIDTPLGRLDSTHRNNFLVTYLPNASKQVIVLSTDEEITGNYLKLIKPYVYKEYLLKYKPGTRSTEIIDGYFKDVTSK